MVIMITVYSMTCPHCGATIDVDADNKPMYCNYCGSRIYIDNGVKKFEINKNIDINKNIEVNKDIKYHKTYVDEAKIKKIESKERIRLEELAYKEREDRRNNNVFFICIGFLFLIMIVCFGLAEGSEQKNKPKEDEIEVPFSAEELEGKNYEVVISDLENAGFTNVKEKQIKDIVVGLVKKDGEVEQVSVNGDSDFTSGTIFPDDAKVVVVYHTPKK